MQASLAESLFAIIACHLSTIIDASYCKFQSFTEGVVFELDGAGDAGSLMYRGNKFSISELLRKTFNGNLDLWSSLQDNDLLPELREFHPASFFKQHINKESSATTFFKNGVAPVMIASQTTNEFPRSSCKGSEKQQNAIRKFLEHA
jgi:hypothetical protein